MKKKRKNKIKTRSFLSCFAKHLKGGTMRSKKDKRQNGKNKQQAYLNDDY